MHLSSIPSIINSFRKCQISERSREWELYTAFNEITSTTNGWIDERVLSYPTLVFGNHNNGHKLVSVDTWFARSIGRTMPGQCVSIYTVCHWSCHALYNGMAQLLLGQPWSLTQTRVQTHSIENFILKALEVVHLVLIDHVATLIQVLDWHRTGDKSLSKAPPRNITDSFLTIKDTVIRIWSVFK